MPANLQTRSPRWNRLEKERERLKKQADELDAIVAGLKQRLEKLNIDLADTRTQSQTRVRELESQLAQSDKTAEEYLAKLKRATELFEGLKVEKHELEQRFTKAELEHQAALLEEGRNNRELVGLTGRLERVAILFDASGSMRQAYDKRRGRSLGRSSTNCREHGSNISTSSSAC